LGIGEKEMFIASDASPIVGYTNKVVYLDDGEMATITRDSYHVKTIDDVFTYQRSTRTRHKH
jgi:glutamine---fructose-6-phosphate transaminase (isomerizing)